MTAAPPTTAAPVAVAAASAPYPRFDIDPGTAVAAVDLDVEEARRISDEFDAPWDPDLSLDACDEVYPGTYALRFTIPEDAGFAYPAELAIMPLTLSGDIGFPVGAQRVTVSGPGTFTAVFSIRALFDAERNGAAAFLVEDLELYFEEECDAVVLDLSGSGLGSDFLSAELLTTGITPMPPRPTAPEGTVQHLGRPQTGTRRATTRGECSPTSTAIRDRTSSPTACCCRPKAGSCCLSRSRSSTAATPCRAPTTPPATVSPVRSSSRSRPAAKRRWAGPWSSPAANGPSPSPSPTASISRASFVGTTRHPARSHGTRRSRRLLPVRRDPGPSTDHTPPHYPPPP